MQLAGESVRFDARTMLFIALGITTAIYVAILIVGLQRAKRDRVDEGAAWMPWLLVTGFVTNFFDTLGIGSFATTTSIFRHWRLVRDEQIPGTLNVGHTLPTIVQAFIYTQLVPVDSRTLILMIVAAVLGAWLGAGVVASWPRRRVQIGMGTALIGAAMLMELSQLHGLTAGGALLGLSGGRLAFAVAVNFALGVLMTIGIGLYAPCMILISLLGMNPTTAFPIMMGSCAFLMPVASARFVRAKCFDRRASIGLFVGGIPAVLIAAFIVKHLPLTAVRWLVVIVVLYTATNLLRTAYRERAAAGLAPSPKPEVAT
jgi:uncharacterized membrane protein YfcA